MAKRVGRGIALQFHDRGTRRGWVVSSTPRPYFTPGKDPVPIVYRRLGGPQGRSGRAENLAPPGFDPRNVQPVVSRYTDWATPPHTHIYRAETYSWLLVIDKVVFGLWVCLLLQLHHLYCFSWWMSIFSVVAVNFVTLHLTLGFSATSASKKKKKLNKPSADLNALYDVNWNGRKMSGRRQSEEEAKQINNL